MTLHRKSSRQLTLLSALIALVAAMVMSMSWEWLETAEDLSIDLRYQARGETVSAPDSIIVGVADSSFTIASRAPEIARRESVLNAMSADWPWDRSVFAALVKKLRASGAKLIVFDIVFAAETAGDAEFARALTQPGAPVVLASWWQEAHSSMGEGTIVLVEPREEFLRANGNRSGYANVWPDDDGTLRKLTATMQAAELLGGTVTPSGYRLPSLAFAAATQLQPDLPERGGYINYRHVPGSIPTLPIEDLFLPDRWQGSWLEGGKLFRDRIVWVGPLSEIRFKDYHATPLGRMPGVETQAQALATFLHGAPLQPMSRTTRHACVWALALVAALAMWSCRRVSLQLLVAGSGVLVWGALALILFNRAGLILPVVAPLGAWVLASGGGLGVRFITEQRERRRIRAVLGRYVSEEVAGIIADQPDKFSHALSGERREVTVLFADVGGFTSWVESAEPEALVAQLNEYFHAIVDCVLAEGGTLQKFIGDAVLAVWGDTRTNGPTQDAAGAVTAAIKMQEAVARLNQQWTNQSDRRPINIGIGLHHGVAMVGNVGHPQRMEFTVLGDVVNVAARLETANRQLGTGILVSETIRDLLASTQRFLPLGPTVFKGKSEAVSVYVPLGAVQTGAPPWLAEAETAHQAWLAGDFFAAAQAYDQLAVPPSPHQGFFQQRANTARHFSQTPPENWQGIHRLENK
ncbi:MAG: adenylate/guanylate cyclase domain-containing protein [Cephaloticoccus sp.]|nr:adenylate/guanylate cyclase domain-containing protein [Cephaloticoccus sp.]MCF7759873.1 adenylate/guanylate cyclase domain-containing protein [Cephaloticoccus sp.]